MDNESNSTFNALPQIDNEVLNFILTDKEGALLYEYAGLASNLGTALARVDQDLDGIGSRNPNLAKIVLGTVEGLYGVFSDQVHGEQNKALLRVFTYFNAFLIIRAIDMQLRKLENGAGGS